MRSNNCVCLEILAPTPRGSPAGPILPERTWAEPKHCSIRRPTDGAICISRAIGSSPADLDLLWRAGAATRYSHSHAVVQMGRFITSNQV